MYTYTHIQILTEMIVIKSGFSSGGPVSFCLGTIELSAVLPGVVWTSERSSRGSPRACCVGDPAAPAFLGTPGAAEGEAETFSAETTRGEGGRGDTCRTSRRWGEQRWLRCSAGSSRTAPDGGLQVIWGWDLTVPEASRAWGVRDPHWFGTWVSLVAGELNSGLMSGKYNLLSWKKIYKTVVRPEAAWCRWMQLDSLNNQAISESLHWTMKSLLSLESQCCATLSVSAEGRMWPKLFSQTASEGLGGMWMATCMHTYVYI